MMKDFSSHQREKKKKGRKKSVCDNVTPDLLISPSLNFFTQGAWKEQSNL